MCTAVPFGKICYSLGNVGSRRITYDTIQEQLRNMVDEEIVNPEGELDVGTEVAQWPSRPNGNDVEYMTGGQKFETASGRVLDRNVMTAR